MLKSTLKAQRQLDQSFQLPQSLCRRTPAFHASLFRSCFILLLMLYIPVAIFYLTATYSKSTPSSHEFLQPNSKMNDRHKSQQHSITSSTLGNSSNGSGNEKSSDDDIVYQKLRNAGVSDIYLQQIRSKLPSWFDIIQQYGDKPIILSLDTSCSEYQRLVRPQNRVLGAAGMFNTGTNLVTQLLKQNCYIPERAALFGGMLNATKEQLGIRWQVPWGKHTPANYKYLHAASEKAATIHVEDVLPIITIRHPYRWIQSMCHNPYSAKWDHDRQCPNILKSKPIMMSSKDSESNIETQYNPVTVQYGAGIETYSSIPHLWNDWYNQYYKHSIHQERADNDINVKENGDKKDQSKQYYPLVIVRMEDLIFNTEDTITSICHCAGGQLYDTNNFKHIVTSAKGDSPGHDTTTDIVKAYMKYGAPIQRGAGLDDTDYNTTHQILDRNLMNIFHYHHPVS